MLSVDIWHCRFIFHGQVRVVLGRITRRHVFYSKFICSIRSICPDNARLLVGVGPCECLTGWGVDSIWERFLLCFVSAVFNLLVLYSVTCLEVLVLGGSIVTYFSAWKFFLQRWHLFGLLLEKPFSFVFRSGLFVLFILACNTYIIWFDPWLKIAGNWRTILTFCKLKTKVSKTRILGIIIDDVQ